MNLLPLLLALIPWAGTPLSAFTRIYLACCLLSIEMQVVTWWNLGTLRGLVPFNIALAVASGLWHEHRRVPRWPWVAPVLRVGPWPLLVALVVVTATLNVSLPVEAADPYQLDRVAQIERLGTLGYDLAANPKVNIAGAFYELMVADLRQLTGVGPQVVRLHGLIGLVLYLITLAAVWPLLGPGTPSAWARAVPLVAPVAFHQLVLLKNDLFLAAPTLVALAWLVSVANAPERRVGWRDALWAAWLVGMVVGSKQVHAPLALVLVLGVWMCARRGALASTAAMAAGGALGGLSAGLLLTFGQNAWAYGDMLATGPVADMGNINRSLGEAVVGLGRFAVSIVDLGLVTPVVWPGRGGWGGTFGLPLIWALAVLIPMAGSTPRVRRVLGYATLHLVAFGLGFPDADLCHRLIIGPGLLLVLTAGLEASAAPKRWPHAALVATVVLSAAQILRSAVLYGLRQ